MRFVLLQTHDSDGPRRLAVPSSSVVEVLPLVSARPIPDAPRGVVGIFDFHGALTPLVDLSALLGGAPTPATFGTRVLVLRHGAASGGFIAERILGLASIDFDGPGSHAGFDPAARGVCGRIARDAEGVVQELRLERLIAGELASVLEGGRA